MSDWTYALDQTVFQRFISQPLSHRRKLMRTFEHLRLDPLQSPAYHIRDATGRELSVILDRPFLITYWNDPMVSEVRIIDLQKL